jgi:RNA polymerase sigma-70 factor (TIGR02960 family)
MLGSFTDAEDMVQEALLRAWRRRETYAGRSTFRAWLYRIATNACLDHLQRHPRHPAGAGEVSWLQPFPDRLLEQAAPPDAEPDAAVVARETIELAFLVAMQLLPPRQRAALIARDVLGWSANETATLLETSVAATNSALQRARTTMAKHLPAQRSEWSAGEPSAEEMALLKGFIDAHERCDAAAAVALAAQDIRVTMPPRPYLIDGLDMLAPMLFRSFGEERDGDWRLVPTQANRMPAAASYLRRPGDTEFRAFKLDLLRCGDGVISEITTFGPELFPAFGLAATLERATG